MTVNLPSIGSLWRHRDRPEIVRVVSVESPHVVPVAGAVFRSPAIIHVVDIDKDDDESGRSAYYPHTFYSCFCEIASV